MAGGVTPPAIFYVVKDSALFAHSQTELRIEALDTRVQCVLSTKGVKS